MISQSRLILIVFLCVPSLSIIAADSAELEQPRAHITTPSAAPVNYDLQTLPWLWDQAERNQTLASAALGTLTLGGLVGTGIGLVKAPKTTLMTLLAASLLGTTSWLAATMTEPDLYW